MADDDQQAPPQRYWFPYWSNPPAPAPRPAALHPRLSRRDTRPAQPQQPPVTPSPSRRQPQAAQPAAATPASRGAGGGGAGSPQAQPQPQPTRLSSRPSPSRAAQPLSPIREPNRGAPPQATAKENAKSLQAKPATPPQPAAHPTKELDITIPQEKIIHEPPSSDTKPQSKALEKEKDKEKEKDTKKEHKEKKDKEGKEKEKEKDHSKEKEKEQHKEKEKEKEQHKEKKDKDKHKEQHDESKLHGGKLHKELKAGVANMVNKLGATTATTTGHERQATGAGMTVITLAGENKGAYMKISHTDQDENKDKERRARKLDEGKQQEAQHGAKGLTAFVNNNVQMVNNSLVMQSSCNSGDPGVHLKLSTKAKKKGANDGDEAGGKGGAPAATTTKKK